MEVLLSNISAGANGTRLVDYGNLMDYYPVWFQVFLWLFVIGISLETILGNLLVLLSFYIDHNLRQPSNCFIASLAISDLIIGIEGFPILTVYVLNGERWSLGVVTCKIWLALDYSLCLVSILTVLLITVDRFCSVCHAAKYRQSQTMGKVQISIVLSWLLPVFLFSATIFGWEYFYQETNDDPTKCYAPFLNDPYVNLCMYITYYWATLVAMIVLYNGIHKTASALEERGRAKERQQKAMAALQQCMAKMGVGVMSAAHQRDAREAQQVELQAREISREATTEQGTVRFDSGYVSNGVANGYATVEDPPVLVQARNSYDTVSSQQHSPLVRLESTKTLASQKSFCTTVSGMSYSDCSFTTAFDLQLFDATSERNSPVWRLQSRPFGRSGNGMELIDDDESSLDSDFSLRFTEYSAVHQKVRRGPSKDSKEIFNLTPVVECHSISDSSYHTATSQGGHTPSYAAPSKVTVNGGSRVKSSLKLRLSNRVSNNSYRLVRGNSDHTDSAFHSPSEAPLVIGELFTPETTPIEATPIAQNDSIEAAVRAGLLSNDLITSASTDDLTIVAQSSTSGIGNGKAGGRPSQLSIQLPTDGGDSSSYTSPIEDEDSSEDSNPEKETRVKRLKKRIRASLAVPHLVSKKPANKSNALATFLNASWLNRVRKKTHAERRARKAFRTITIILGSFVALWSPYFILATLYGFCPDCVPSWLFMMSYYMCYINSSLNPFCYALANRQYRNAFLRILRGDLERR